MTAVECVNEINSLELNDVIDRVGRAAVQEVYPDTPGCHAAAFGFAVAMALQAARGKPLVWVRQDFLDTEAGEIHGPGLHEFGLDPARIILVRVRDTESVLRAAEQSVRCAALGGVVIETWGEPKILNFTASRRLALATSKSNVPLFMVRVAAAQAQSAAVARWMVRASPSRALEANAPGFAAFEVTLLRHRGGMAGARWRVEWNREQQCFQDIAHSAAAPLSRPVVPLSHHRQAASPAPHAAWRRAG